MVGPKKCCELSSVTLVIPAMCHNQVNTCILARHIYPYATKARIIENDSRASTYRLMGEGIVKKASF